MADKEVFIPFRTTITVSPSRPPARPNTTGSPSRPRTVVVTPSKPSQAAASPSPAAASATEADKQPEAAEKPLKTGSLALFFRKVYHVAAVRLQDLCERLKIETRLRQQIWTCFQHALTSCTQLMVDRHIDQILMCSIYIICKVTQHTRSFQDIMKSYRLQPQARSHVYRCVVMRSRRRRGSGSSLASGASSPTSHTTSDTAATGDSRRPGVLRSGSIIQTSSSAPPSPTRSSSHPEEDSRADLIKFYNAVYIRQVKSFAIRFSQHSQEKGVAPPQLSPLPTVRVHPGSPRRVTSSRPIYVSPRKLGQEGGGAEGRRDLKASPMSKASRMVYRIQTSPYKDLKVINEALRPPPATSGVKRLLQDNMSDGDSSSAKRLCPESPLYRRLAGVSAERLEAQQQQQLKK